MTDPVIKDDAYWAEVRASIGRGTPSILLGTSKRSLDRAVTRLREADAMSSKFDRAMDWEDLIHRCPLIWLADNGIWHTRDAAGNESVHTTLRRAVRWMRSRLRP